MSKLPRKAPGQDILKVLQRNGFEIRPGRGSHVGAWKRMDRKTVFLSVPLHKEIKPGLLNAIIAESGIPRDEFIRQLREL